ncbi:MAG: vWA domain-containing protein [Polyangiaceae bacterium]
MFSAVLVSGAAVGVACGARTGLDAPGGGAGPLGCVPGTAELERAVPALMFVVDASGSMDDALEGAGVSRWDAMRSAFAATLPPVDTSMELGLMVYPSNGGEKNCAAGHPAITPGLGHVGTILDALDDRKPRGATPTAAALDAAATALEAHRAAAGARTLVLATDGGPNCNTDLDPKTCECVPAPVCKESVLCLDDARTVSTIEDLAKRGIPTYVIGIAAADDTFIGVLDEMADAGGRARVGEDPRFYPVASAADFDLALATIRDQVGACTYLTRSIPDPGGTIVVRVDGAEVPFDPTGADGWSWSDLSNGELVFTGDACASLTSGSHTVQALVTCGADATTSADASSSSGSVAPP